ncbi:transposase [Pseudotabrizicola sp.]|uniref:transposase n=1 Tax=Pseudotabrizicola sp. TaxID=2939647 RepID=UPI002723DCEF|nr:transposase [Pseudotabrizicola sp.]MDO8882811.1 transposase [Pseudotabrizicola sp.]
MRGLLDDLGYIDGRIGALGPTALVAATGDGRQFRKARDLAAWLGLVPVEHSTGGKQTLLGISKRGKPRAKKRDTIPRH